MEDIIEEIKESISVKENLIDQAKIISEISKEIIKKISNGGKVVLFGNGGSAADAQHIAAEFMGRYMDSELSLPALALNTNTSAITAIANDFSYDDSFSKQVNALVSSSDVVIGISTSGNSKNVINGLVSAKRKGALTIGLTGRTGGKLVSVSDHVIRVPSDNTQRIQESHILIGHILCRLIREGCAHLNQSQ